VRRVPSAVKLARWLSRQCSKNGSSRRPPLAWDEELIAEEQPAAVLGGAGVRHVVVIGNDGETVRRLCLVNCFYWVGRRQRTSWKHREEGKRQDAPQGHVARPAQCSSWCSVRDARLCHSANPRKMCLPGVVSRRIRFTAWPPTATSAMLSASVALELPPRNRSWPLARAGSARWRRSAASRTGAVTGGASRARGTLLRACVVSSFSSGLAMLARSTRVRRPMPASWSQWGAVARRSATVSENPRIGAAVVVGAAEGVARRTELARAVARSRDPRLARRRRALDPLEGYSAISRMARSWDVGSSGPGAEA